MERVLRFLEERREEAVELLKGWLAIPSVSTDPAHKSDLDAAANYIARILEDAGLKVEILDTGGHPAVYAEWSQAEAAPTVLVYGHYDVQPPDPVDEWLSPPFEPTIRENKIYARGATDDKGQCFTHVRSVQAWLATVGRLPVNVKFLIEGEEEIGSPHLEGLVRNNVERFKCDYVVVSDTAQFAPGVPAITYGLRGLVYAEIFLSGPKTDLHSGVFGGAVANPANNLAAILGAMVDSQGRVQIPGFYDQVRPIEPWEREEFSRLPFDEAGMRNYLGVDALWGEPDYSVLERRWCRPTCDINGLTSGYQGVGAKTIIPARASAKVSCRLVPDQDPQAIFAAMQQYVRERLWPGIKAEIVSHGLAPAVLMDVKSPGMRAARKAIARAFGREPVLIREGGSIPVVATFKEVLGVDTLLLGWGQNDDNLHAPNEKFSLDDFHRGTLASALLWEELAALYGATGAAK